ncbi:MAG: methyltransferase [Planctomycetota bacterium]
MSDTALAPAPQHKNRNVGAILLLPAMAIIMIPATIFCLAGADTFDLWRMPPATRVVLPALGLFFAFLGLTLMIATIRLFAAVGRGTLAPWDPTQRLVVQGVYRRVRNSMISGVMAILLGEAIGAASLPLACWFFVFAVVNAIYIPLAEEPGLVRRFGVEYEEYRRNVPRWIPLLKAWTG